MMGRSVLQACGAVLALGLLAWCLPSVSGCSGSEAAEPDTLTWAWSPAADGALAVFYDTELRWEGQDWYSIGGSIDTLKTVVIPDEVQPRDLQLRVRGVSVDSVRGPWSIPSDPWSDPVPGVTGQPRMVRGL